jgi:hypothetical protein
MPNVVRRKKTAKETTPLLKITLEGYHSPAEKICMASRAFESFEHEHNFKVCGPVHMYCQVADEDHRHLDRFPDGILIKDCCLTIAEPYPCAADEYDRKYSAPPPKPR